MVLIPAALHAPEQQLNGVQQTKNLIVLTPGHHPLVSHSGSADQEERISTGPTLPDDPE